MFAKSRRLGATNLCPIYARRAAERWLGPGAWHACDESCQHDYACERCKFSYVEKKGRDWNGEPYVVYGCLIQDGLYDGEPLTTAYRNALALVR